MTTACLLRGPSQTFGKTTCSSFQSLSGLLAALRVFQRPPLIMWVEAAYMVLLPVEVSSLWGGDALGLLLRGCQQVLQLPLLQGSLNVQSETNAVVGCVARVLVILTVKREILVLFGLHWLGRSQGLCVREEDITWRLVDLGPITVPRFFLGCPVVALGINRCLCVGLVAAWDVRFGIVATIPRVRVALVIALGVLAGGLTFRLGLCLGSVRFERPLSLGVRLDRDHDVILPLWQALLA
ncbi:hypothetical protein HanRHA438_Chr03g0105881 [Helianthus annuus]|nr:hypothetical protein HanRHA438_Chr03g0105881 [Helianthus annuus]